MPCRKELQAVLPFQRQWDDNGAYGKSMDVLWDDALRGFGVVVLPSGRKTFVVQCKRNGRSRKVKIGVFGPTTAEQARAQALNLLGAIEAGADPVAERRAARAVRTFRQVAEDFMAQHVLTKRKPRTAESDVSIRRGPQDRRVSALEATSSLCGF